MAAKKLPKEKTDFILANFPRLSRSECAKRTGLTYKQVDQFIFRQMPNEKQLSVIPEDVKLYLKNNYWKLGIVGCARELGLHFNRVMRWAEMLKLSVAKGHHNEEHKNKECLSHIYALNDPFVIYFLGFLWADGHISKKDGGILFKIKKVDFEQISERLMKIAKSAKRYERTPKNKKPQTLWQINHIGFNNWLREHDYHLKSGASADKILNAIPEELRHYWWRGYFDGDGTSNKCSISFSSCYEQDWNFLSFIENNLDIKFTTYKKISKSGSKSSNPFISGYVYKNKFYNYIYSGQQFGLDRKKKSVEKSLISPYKKTEKSSSKYRGVHLTKYKKWRCSITHKGQKFSKSFESELEAAKSYDYMATKMKGNKAVLNFPNE